MDSQLSAVLEDAKMKKDEIVNVSYTSSTDSQSIFDESKAFQQYDKCMTLTSVNKPLIPVKKINMCNNNVNNQTHVELYFDLVSSTAKQPGLRKRANKIDSSNILNIATQQLDISTDSSDVTLSQKQLDSQEYAPYLRKKDKPRNNAEGATIKVQELSYAGDYLAEGVDEIDYPYPANTTEDNQMDTTPPPLSPIPQETFRMFVNVEKRVKKLDFSIENHDEKLYLWTKVNVSIPISVECAKGMDGVKRRIVIKFLRLGAKDDLSFALRNQLFEVKKCKNCVERETRYPQESFCYVEKDTPNIDWHTRYSLNGAQIDAEISDEQQRIDFYLQFSCREMCMSPDMKKGKLMVFVLEHLDGTEISRACIDSVRIVAYPDRDRNNFLNDTNKNNSKKMHNVTNQFQDPMINSMKRKASVLDPCLKNEKVNNVFAKNDYQQRLMLGASRQAAENNVEMEEDEENVVKRSRQTIPNVMRFKVVGEERIAKVIDFLADLEKRDRYNASMERNRMSAPLRAVGRIDMFTKIEDWLSTMKLGHLINSFHQRAILNVGDLVSRYEQDDNIFEKLIMSREEETIILQTFLNFYHVHLQENQKLYRKNLTV